MASSINVTGHLGLSYDDLAYVNEQIHIVTGAVTVFAVGCRLLSRDFERLEKGLCVGLFLQSVILPPMGCLLAMWFELAEIDALAMIATASAPVASSVSVLTHWGKGNVALSVLLTVLSTTLTIGLLPLWFFVYSSRWTTTVVVVPHPSDVSLYLALVIAPLTCGMFVRRLLPRVAKKLAKFLSFAFLADILVTTVLIIIVNPSHFDANIEIWEACFVLPVFAYVLGFISAFVLNLPYEKCVAVSMAVGISNTNLIITTAHRLLDHPGAILRIPEIYGVFAPMQGLAWAMLYKKCHTLVHEKYPNIFSSKEYDEK